MIQRLCAVCCLLLIGCAPSPAIVMSSTDDATVDQNVYCFWKKTNWYSYAPLSLPGLTEPIGMLSGVKGHQLSLTAELHGSGSGHAMLEGTLRNDIVDLPALVDATNQDLLHLTMPKSQGTWLHLLKNSSVRVFGGRRGFVTAGPASASLDGITPVQPAVFETRCEELSVWPAPMKVWKEGEPETYPAEIEALGLKADLPFAEVNSAASLPLSETPGGPAVASIDFSKFKYLRVIEKRADGIRIGEKLREGLFVIGWLPVELSPALTTDLGGGGLGLLGGASTPQVPAERHLCITELPLGIRRDNAVHPWGTVHANVPFEVLGPASNGWFKAKVENFHFSAWKDTELVLPESALTCPPLAPAPQKPSSAILLGG